MKPPPNEDKWVMRYYCGSNQQCAQDLGAATGHYAFDTAQECLDWQNEFKNYYLGVSVTSCNYL